MKHELDVDGGLIGEPLPNELHMDGCLIRGLDRVLNHEQSRSLSVLINYDFGQIRPNQL